MLTSEQEIEVKEYETAKELIRKKRQELDNEEKELLESHEEYANYLSHYESYYGDDGYKLTMRAYFEAVNEFDMLMDENNAIMKKINANDPDADWGEMEAFERRTAVRFGQLERMLAA